MLLLCSVVGFYRHNAQLFRGRVERYSLGVTPILDLKTRMKFWTVRKPTSCRRRAQLALVREQALRLPDAQVAEVLGEALSVDLAENAAEVRPG